MWAAQTVPGPAPATSPVAAAAGDQQRAKTPAEGSKQLGEKPTSVFGRGIEQHRRKVAKVPAAGQAPRPSSGSSPTPAGPQQQAEQRAERRALATTHPTSWRGGRSLCAPPKGSRYAAGPEVVWRHQPAPLTARPPRPIKPERGRPPEAPSAAARGTRPGWDQQDETTQLGFCQRAGRRQPRRVRGMWPSRQD